VYVDKKGNPNYDLVFNYGDGSPIETYNNIFSDSFLTSHVYSSPGIYTISVQTVFSGCTPSSAVIT